MVKFFLLLKWSNLTLKNMTFNRANEINRVNNSDCLVINQSRERKTRHALQVLTCLNRMKIMMQSKKQLSFLLYSFTILFLLATPFFTSAQTTITRFTGNVYDKLNGQPIQFAILKLNRAADSSLVDGAISDSNGKFTLKAKANGDYFVSVTLIGYKPVYIESLVADSLKKQVDLHEINLVKSRKELREFFVKGNNFMQIDVDKIVYKVANTPIGTTGTASDVMQTLPSVFVNLEGDVTIRGGKVRLFIDGRPSGIFGISRSQVLNYIPASMIDRIEVIKDPSSKYDADGGSGIINIILKTDQSNGLNGLVILGGGTGNKANGSINISNNFRKWKFACSYDGRTAIMGNFEERHRESTRISTTKMVNQNRFNISETIHQNLRLKTSYIPNKKNAFDITYLHSNMRDRDIIYFWYKHLNEVQKLTKSYDRIINEEQKDQTNNLSAHFTRKFKKSSQVLTTDASYFTTNENTSGDIRQQYYNLDLSLSTKPPYLYQTDRNVKEKNLYFQVDYVQPIRKNMKAEMGLKTRYRANNIDYQLLNFDYVSNEFNRDTFISNQFKYVLNINAGYLTFRNKVKKNSYKLGLRAEQSSIKYKIGNMDSSIEQKYLNLFPSLNLLHEFNKKNKLTFRYSRRIDRPNFNELNPIQKLNDTLFLERGNPSLVPKIINHGELAEVLNFGDNSINVSVYYIHSNQDIQRVSVLDTSGVTTTNFQNLKTSDQFGLDISTFIQPSKWCRANGSFSVYHNSIDGSNVMPIFVASYFAYNAKLNFNFLLPKKFYFQVDGNYQSGTYAPFVHNKSQYYADLSVKKDLDHRRFTVAMRLSDIFYTQRRITEFSGVNFLVNSSTYRRSRILLFSLTYRPFVKRKKQEDNKLEEEDPDSETNTPEE